MASPSTFEQFRMNEDCIYRFNQNLDFRNPGEKMYETELNNIYNDTWESVLITVIKYSTASIYYTYRGTGILTDIIELKDKKNKLIKNGLYRLINIQGDTLAKT